jgi:ATP synthase protein I
MSVSLYNKKVACNLLLLQLMASAVLSAAFSWKSFEWAHSALIGGLAAWLPNAVFIVFVLRHQARTSASIGVAWGLAIGEGLKIMITIALLIVALAVFNVPILPLGLAYIAVLVVQIVASVVIHSYQN